MLRALAWFIAAALHLAAPAVAILGYAFADSALPPEPFRHIICVFPIDQLNPLSLAQGATEPEVDALFGVRSTQARRQQPDWCVRYQYSPSLSYTLLFRHGAVDSMWLTEGAFVPYLCEGILVKSVHVPLRSWYPSEAPRYTTRCRCSPGDVFTCGDLDAAEQGDEADEAWSTSELRSLSPVLGGLVAGAE